MGPASIEYANKVTEDGRKYICPIEPEASLVRWVYEELSTGKWFIDQIWKSASEKGLKSGRKNFWKIIRNPIYCGRIPIAKFKEEEAHTVKGQHEPIVSEGIFFKAMDVLNGRNKPKKTTIFSPDMLPLRCFPICP